MSSYTIYTVNSFVDSQQPETVQGNPAGVCLLNKPIAETDMQTIASEMNLSETAFVTPQPRGEFAIRWFTPTTEVPLCGHATLASAHILLELGVAHDGFAINFESASGQLKAVANQHHITLSFPRPEALETVNLTTCKNAIWETLQPLELYRSGPQDDKTLLAILKNEAAVQNFDALAQMALIKALDRHGLIITAVAEPNNHYQIISRYFAPAIGVPEDPATGSAHCILAEYWCPKLKQDTINAFQASARGGRLNITLKHDRILLEGEALTVSQKTTTHLSTALIKTSN